MIGRVCWFVRWFFSSFVTLVEISRKVSPIFVKFGTNVQYPDEILTANFSEVKVKVQGQNALLKIFHL